MKPAEVKRRIAREAKRQIEQQGFTRKRIEQHIRKMLRPRPRWFPKWAWAAIASIVIRGTGALEQAELDQAERDLLDALMLMEGWPPWTAAGGSVIQILLDRVKSLRAHVPQSVAQ